MKNLIKGDIMRIMRKKSLWVAFIAALIVNVLMIMFYLFSMNNSSLNYVMGNLDGMGDIGGMVIGIAVFLAVYNDDFKSMTIISIIGRGNSRLRIIIAKFINSVIITLILYAVFALQVLVMTKVIGMELLPDERVALCLGVFRGIYITIGYVTMAAIVIYATGNNAFSVFMLVMFYLIIPNVLPFASNLPVVRNIHIERYDYCGLCSNGLSNIILGMTFRGVMILILAFIIYVGASIAIICKVFNKKELDF
ncbi:MAG: ABC transporter permease [Lachnospiraceae bacterium]|nr:ABC transporter permease [Lachnospiraceae bacterium]